jgi:hypothetical protein
VIERAGKRNLTGPCYFPGCGKPTYVRITPENDQSGFKIPVCKEHMAEFGRLGQAFFEEFWRREP